jgi:hypothetical protein
MHANDLNDTPSKSAARLAAEALFEQRRPAAAPTDPSVPVVKVISRRRLPAPDEPGAAGTATEGGADSAAPARKTPRVFVLRPAAPAPSAPAAESQSLVPAVPVRRRRTRAAPVTVIYSAPPAPAADTAAAALDDAELPSSTRLASALAAVDPILAEIRAARSFEIRPQTQAAEWARLSAQAERIAQDLAVWALNPFTPPPEPARRR